MSRLLRKLASAACLLLATGTVWAFVYLGLMREAPLAAILWPVAAAMLGVLCGALPRKARVVGTAAGLIALLAAYVLWMPEPLLLVALALYAVLYIAIVWRANTQPFAEWSILLMIGGLALYPLGMMVVRLTGLEDIRPLLRTLMMIYLPAFLLYTNHFIVEVSASARDGRRPPLRMRRANTWMVAGLSAVLLIVTNLGAIREAFYAVTNWIGSVIGAFISWFMGLFASEPAEEVVQQMESSPALPMEAATEEAAGSPLLDAILNVLAIAVVVVLAATILYMVGRLMIRLVRRLVARVREMVGQLGEGAADQAESILDWEEVRNAARTRVAGLRARLRRPPRWEDLDNRGRVRWTYGQWKAGRPAIPPSATAREALHGVQDGAQMADIYERARYSDDEITDGEAVFLRDALRREE